MAVGLLCAKVWGAKGAPMFYRFRYLYGFMFIMIHIVWLEFWRGVYFGGLPVFRAIHQYFFLNILSALLCKHSFPIYTRLVAGCTGPIG